jgi:selenide,water dikinase
MVDDPYTFGQIAATNALSDVYAMGGQPRTSLALVCFPEKADLAILERVLAGGLSKMIEAGCSVIGGHSVRDEEMKFGYSVTGLIDPTRVLKNGGALTDDRLLFSKALGTGVISTAIKKKAAEVITGGFAVHAMTDVTGFGLIGHAREIALASNVSLRFSANRIPLIEGALECVRAGHIPGGLKANREFAECVVGYEDGISEEVKTIMFDPQTAGGLLISVASEDATDLTRALNAAGVPAVEIGEVLPASKPLITVAP